MEGLTIEGGRSHWTDRHTIGTQAGITLALGFLAVTVAVATLVLSYSAYLYLRASNLALSLLDRPAQLPA